LASKNILKLKQEIRKVIQKKRRNQSGYRRDQYSLKIWNRLKKSKDFKQAKRIMFYAAIPEEVETRHMIEESIKSGKKVLVPFVNRKKQTMSACFIKSYRRDLEKGCFGIPEPKKELRRVFNKKNIDLVIVPGSAFDLKGTRIGFGGGYYDRFLKTLKKKTKIALAFDFQLDLQLPSDLHDVKMDKIITGRRIIDCRGTKNKRNETTRLHKINAE